MMNMNADHFLDHSATESYDSVHVFFVPNIDPIQMNVPPIEPTTIERSGERTKTIARMIVVENKKLFLLLLIHLPVSVPICLIIPKRDAIG